MPDALELDFVASDESVNRYGYWVKTDGIRTENFMKNPVFVYQHNTDEASIGKIIDLQKQEGKLLIKVEFDPDDTDAVKIYNKYNNGFMNAVSVSFRDVTLSDDPAYLKPGQKYPTVLECELLEISAVTLPGNTNAIKLYGDGGEELKLNFIKQNFNNMPENDNKVQELEQRIASLESTLTEERKLRAETMVDSHIKRGVINVNEREMYVAEAQKDFAKASQILSEKKGREVIDNFKDGMQNNVPKDKTYRELADTEPETLKLMYEQEFEKFNKLFKAEYGFDYQKK